MEIKNISPVDLKIDYAYSYAFYKRLGTATLTDSDSTREVQFSVSDASWEDEFTIHWNGSCILQNLYAPNGMDMLQLNKEQTYYSHWGFVYVSFKPAYLAQPYGIDVRGKWRFRMKIVDPSVPSAYLPDNLQVSAHYSRWTSMRTSLEVGKSYAFTLPSMPGWCTGGFSYESFSIYSYIRMDANASQVSVSDSLLGFSYGGYRTDRTRYDYSYWCPYNNTIVVTNIWTQPLYNLNIYFYARYFKYLDHKFDGKTLTFNLTTPDFSTSNQEHPCLYITGTALAQALGSTLHVPNGTRVEDLHIVKSSNKGYYTPEIVYGIYDVVLDSYHASEMLGNSIFGTWRLELETPPKPDLTITNISWAPQDPVEGETVTFIIGVRNNGTANASSFKVAYYIDNISKGEWQIPVLLGGQELTKNFTWPAEKGTHTARAVVDSQNTVSEEDEGNNAGEVTIQISPAPKPDLTISDFHWIPTSPKENDPMNFTVTINNEGNASASSFKVAYLIDGTKLGEWSVSDLKPHQNTSRTFIWNAINGTHTAEALADCGQNVDEWNETNNERKIEFQVGNQSPVASFCCSNEYNYMNNSVVFMDEFTCFDASESYDPDGSIVSFSWNFGDGNLTTVDNPIVLHSYAGAGTYTVTLNTTDNQGSWNTATINVRVVLMGDLDNDGKVNILDITVVSRVYGSKLGDQNWNPNADFTGDNVINILDISMIAKQFGKQVGP